MAPPKFATAPNYRRVIGTLNTMKNTRQRSPSKLIVLVHANHGAHVIDQLFFVAHNGRSDFYTQTSNLHAKKADNNSYLNQLKDQETESNLGCFALT